MKKMQGMVTGMLLGAAAVTMYGMMDARTQRRLQRKATCAGKKVVHFANDLFDR